MISLHMSGLTTKQTICDQTIVDWYRSTNINLEKHETLKLCINGFNCNWRKADNKRKTDGFISKVRKTAKIRNEYNQVPHLTQDTT